MHLAIYSHYVRPPGAHQMLAGLVSAAQRPKMLTLCMCTAVLMGCSALYSDIIAYMMLKHTNVPPWCSPNASRAIISAIQRPKHAHSIYVYSDLSHIMLWVAGGNCPNKCQCNRIRGERYRGTRLVTLPYLKLV